MSETQDYQPRTMNAGAHRRPPPQIGAPALIWQRGYWIPETEKIWLSDEEGHNSPWRQSLDNTLAQILKRLQVGKRARFRSPNYNPQNDTLYLFDSKVVGFLNGGDKLHHTVMDPSERSVRHDVFIVRVIIGSEALIVSARRHYEYFTLLFALDFSRRKFELAAGRKQLNRVWKAFYCLHEIISRRYTTIAMEMNAESVPGPVQDPHFNTDLGLAFGHVNLMTTTLKQYMDRLTRGLLSSSASAENYVGEKFADFFGIAYSISIGDQALAYPARDVGDIRLTRATEVSGSLFDDHIAASLLSAAWPPVVAADYKEEWDRLFGEPERVVAAFNTRQTLYSSSLGRKMPDVGQVKLDPLVYTLIVSYRSPWRLGRLIDKVNTLGTLRLAALRDLKFINGVSNEINGLSVALRAYDRKQRSKKDPNSTAGQATQKQHSITDIDREFRSMDDKHSIGIKYRTERSRYYLKSYETTLSSLGASKVMGFQFYEDFIRTRIYDAFDYIDGVGVRYDNLRQEIELRISSRSLEEMRALQTSIEKQTRTGTKLLAETRSLQHSIDKQTGAGNKLLLETQTLHRSIAKQTHAATALLSTAETISVVPLTYYGGHIIAELSNGLIPLELSFMLAFVMSVFLSIVLHRRRRRAEPLEQISTESS